MGEAAGQGQGQEETAPPTRASLLNKKKQKNTKVICAVLLLPVISTEHRTKRQVSWGPVNDSSSNRNQNRQVSRETTTTTEDPRKYWSDEEIRATVPECAPHNPAVPDYSKPGRRISTVKCLETIWDIQFRKEKAAKLLKCAFEISRIKGVFSSGGGIGGRDALDGEFPHMGAVGWKASQGTWIFKCGAILISNKFVLTAGHCTRVTDKDPTVSDPVPKIVRIGDKNILDKESSPYKLDHPEDADISRIIKHPSYQPPKKYNDIAIMEFAKPVEFRFRVHPACLWVSSNTSALGTKATITGWGVIETNSRKTSPILQVVVLDLIEREYCDTLLRSWCNRLWCGLQDNQICAGKLEGGADACQGDSGGPLQVKIALPKKVTTRESMYYVIGVTSFGIGCAKPNTPGVYTRISSYIDWIEQIVWGRN